MESRVRPCKRATSPSRLPGLDWAINPYRGCAHACAYCYAQDVTRFEASRPWGDVVEVKAGIVQSLKKEIESGHMAGVFGVGTVTDPYQPLEAEYELTRGCLALLKRRKAKVSILTKSDLVLRDLDLLREWTGAEVGISVGILDRDMAGVLEPGAPPPERRLHALKELAESGVSAYLMAAPIIPGVSDGREAIERLVSSASRAGVRRIIWDQYNPKPMASSRLGHTLIAHGIDPCVPSSKDGASRVRGFFVDASRELRIEVVDAF